MVGIGGGSAAGDAVRQPVHAVPSVEGQPSRFQPSHAGTGGAAAVRIVAAEDAERVRDGAHTGWAVRGDDAGACGERWAGYAGN